MFRSLRMLLRPCVRSFLEKKFVRDWFGKSLNDLGVVGFGMEFDFGEEVYCVEGCITSFFYIGFNLICLRLHLK